MKKNVFLFLFLILTITICKSQNHFLNIDENTNHNKHYDPIIPQETNLKIQSLKYQIYNKAAAVNCPPNIDFEEGNFNNWSCDTGFVRGVVIDPNTNQPISTPFGASSNEIGRAHV